MLAIVALLLINNKQHISASLVPANIVSAFNKTHTTARDIDYTLNVDDAGISYIVSYTLDGRRYTTEYNYSEWAQLGDGEAVAMDEDEKLGDVQGEMRKTSF